MERAQHWLKSQPWGGAELVWTWERLGERDALHSNALKVCAVRAGACWSARLVFAPTRSSTVLSGCWCTQSALPWAQELAVVDPATGGARPVASSGGGKLPAVGRSAQEPFASAQRNKERIREHHKAASGSLELTPPRAVLAGEHAAAAVLGRAVLAPGAGHVRGAGHEDVHAAGPHGGRLRPRTAGTCFALPSDRECD